MASPTVLRSAPASTVLVSPIARSTLDAPTASPAPPLYWLNVTAELPGVGPGPRYGAAIAYDPALNATVLFGGVMQFGCCNATYYDDTWTLAGRQWTQLSEPLAPSARAGAVMTWDPADGELLLFGGVDASGTGLRDTWAFIGSQWFPVKAAGAPPGLTGQSLAWDAVDGYAVLFGGANYTATPYAPAGPYNYTYTFANDTWTNRTDTVTGAPVPSAFGCMTYDSSDGEVVHFGGWNGTLGGGWNRTYTFVRDSWQRVTGGTSPPVAEACGLTDDASVQGALMFDPVATTSGAKGETWQFRAGTWTDLSPNITGQPTRDFPIELIDQPNAGYVLLYGSDDLANPVNATWTLGPPVIGQLVASPASLDVGQTTVLNATPWFSTGSVTYTFTGLPPGCGAPTAGVVGCTPNSSGAFEVAATLNDSIGYSVSEFVTVRVDPALSAPAVTVTPDPVSQGEPFVVRISAGNGTAPYQYAFPVLPPGCPNLDAAQLNCTAKTPGTYSFEVRVTDASGEHAIANGSVDVTPPLSIPLFLSSPSALDLGQSLNLSVTVAAGRPPFTFHYSHLPGNCSGVDAPTLTCTPSAPGVFAVTVNVSDADGVTAGAVTGVTVDPDPTVVEFGAGSGATDVGVAATFQLTLSNGTAPFDYRYSGLPPGCDSADAPVLSCVPQTEGVWAVQVNATDAAGRTVTASTTLTVALRPAIAGVIFDPQPTDSGQNVTIGANESAGTPPLSFEFTGLPAQCAGTGAEFLSCAPSAGTYPITVTVTDAAGVRAAGAGTLVVHGKLSAHLSAEPGPTTSTGDAVTLATSLLGGAAPYRFTYSGLPPGCPASDAANLTCAPTAAGNYSISVVVVDSAGAQVTASTYLQVAGTSPLTALPSILLVVVPIAAVIGAGLFLLRRRRTAARRTVPAEEAPQGYPEREPELEPSERS